MHLSTLLTFAALVASTVVHSNPTVNTPVHSNSTSVQVAHGNSTTFTGGFDNSTAPFAEDHKKKHKKKHKHGNPCKNKKSGTCQYNHKGNTHIWMGHKTNWGTVHPHDLINEIPKACNSAGHCNEIKHHSTFLTPGPHESEFGVTQSGHVSLKLHNFQYGDGQLGDMIDAIRRTVGNRNHINNRCAEVCGRGHCTPCAFRVKQNIAPSAFDIKVPGKNLMQLHIEVKITIDTGDNAAICEDIFTGASAVAGAVAGPAAGVLSGLFSLASLAC